MLGVPQSCGLLPARVATLPIWYLSWQPNPRHHCCAFWLAGTRHFVPGVR